MGKLPSGVQLRAWTTRRPFICELRLESPLVPGDDLDVTVRFDAPALLDEMDFSPGQFEEFGGREGYWSSTRCEIIIKAGDMVDSFFRPADKPRRAQPQVSLSSFSDTCSSTRKVEPLLRQLMEVMVGIIE